MGVCVCGEQNGKANDQMRVLGQQLSVCGPGKEGRVDEHVI